MVDYTLPATSTDPLDPDIWGEDLGDTFAVFDEQVEAPRALEALRSWRAAQAGRWTTPARIVAVGSSSTAGTGAALDTRYANRLGDILHAGLNPPGIVGGAYIAGVDTGWATSGTVGTNAFGLGLQSATLAIGATMSRTVAATTGFTVLFEQGPGAGQFSISIDGGGATTITPDTTGAANRHDGTVSTGVLTVGSHSILLTAIGACVISGVYAHNGDLAAGVQVYQSGRTGAVAADFAGLSIPTRIAQLGAGLVTIMLGSNDYDTQVNPVTFAASLTTLIDNIKATVYPPPSILLLGTYRRLDTAPTTYPWSAYLGVMRELAADDPTNVAYANLSGPFPSSNGVDAFNVLDPDLIHPTPRGHAMIADLAAQAIRTPRLTGMTVNTPATAAPASISGLLAHWDAGTIAQADNTAVGSWAPASGSETTPLTAAGALRPTFLVNQINGLPAVSFAAASTQSLEAIWATSHPVPVTVACVGRFGLNGVLPMNWFTGRAGVFVYLGSTPTIVQVGAGAAGELNSREPADLAWHVAVVVYDGANTRIHWDSRRFTTRGTTGTGANAALSQGMRLGTNSGAGNNWLQGALGEVAVYNRALTVTEAGQLVAHCGNKYGLEVA